VEAKDTVGAIMPGMPMVAATPWLVGVAELACGRLVLDLLEPGQITVGSRVVIDHLGPSKVGAELCDDQSWSAPRPTLRASYRAPQSRLALFSR
jgi:predicted thioesterase